MSEKYYKMDLHIHTPASSCFKGENSEEEYINILKEAKAKNINIIAITDHNTVAGYEKLLSIRDKLTAKIELLNELAEINELTKNEEIVLQVIKLKEQLSLFREIKILLGVEITINPGIHIIVIAKDEAISELKQILTHIGYIDQNRGNDSDTVTNIEVIELLKMPELENMIVIAPHVDSEKGIYNVLSGNYRAHVFKADLLNAISCNSLEQLNKIKGNLLTKPQYKRNVSLGFINSSDAHCIQDIGSKVSFIKLPNISFNEILNAFNNPEQTISDTDNPEIVSLVENFIDSGKAIILEEETEEDILKAVCACLNNKYGHILVGVSKENHSLIGVTKTKKELDKLITEAIKNINTKLNTINIKIMVEPLGSGRNILIYTLRSSSPYICSVKEEVFIFNNDLLFKRASISEIEQLIQSNVINELKKIDIKNDALADKISLSLNCFKGSISKYELEYNIINLCIPLNIITEVLPVSPNKAIGLDSFDLNGIGVVEGNAYIPYESEPRLDNAYLRCSCPSYNIKDKDKLVHLKKFSKPAIIITGKGGCYLIEKEEWYLYSTEEILVVTQKDDEYTLKYLTAWLKSSLLLWYLLWKHNSINIFNPKIFESIIVPNRKIKIKEICDCVDLILETERDFLNKFNSKIAKDPENFHEQEEDIKKHNELVLETAKIIDHFFIEHFSIPESQLQLIANDIKANNIFCY